MNNTVQNSPVSSIPFGSRLIGPGHPVVVIAEIGINHEGDVEVCKRMVEAAARAGVDAVKLQTIDPEENYAPDTPSYALFRRAQLSREETAHIFKLGHSLGLEVFTTAGDYATLEWVDRLEPAAHKISSGLLTHLPLIARAAATGRSLLMSTGMAGPEQVEEAVTTARKADCEHLGLFHCVSLYPAPLDKLHLRRIETYAKRFGVPVGFSDHSLGIPAAVLAVAAGARMIEKHFTLDRTRAGFDHHLSLEPREMADLVREVRDVEDVLGSAMLECSPDMKNMSRMFYRSLAARCDIQQGEIVTEGMVAFLRTLPEKSGLEPARLSEVLGRRVLRDIARSEAFTEGNVEATRPKDKELA